ncbi:recombinase family protein [Klebsiella quasipneumoniae]|uniref:recombinase family protein n=1 Tax=Klebsiella quasipneumoniae TaxID=1463165 RepID=UPI00388DFFAB
MKIGYARKSTHLQDVAHQVDELTKAGCEQIYQDQTSRSGPKRDKKGAPELENCLKALREGDTLVVWALDRLGGSLSQVITLLDDLKKRGITFIDIKDRIDTREGANKQVISSQADSLIKISRIWADFFPANNRISLFRLFFPPFLALFPVFTEISPTDVSFGPPETGWPG